MFKQDKKEPTIIKCNRGNKGSITVRKKNKNTGEFEKFNAGDKVVLSVKQNFAEEEPAIRKIIEVTEETDSVTFSLSKDDTTIGELISEPVTYQYDIAINDDNTILGYDDDGPKKFIVYPEGSNDQ